MTKNLKAKWDYLVWWITTFVEIVRDMVVDYFRGIKYWDSSDWFMNGFLWVLGIMCVLFVGIMIYENETYQGSVVITVVELNYYTTESTTHISFDDFSIPVTSVNHHYDVYTKSGETFTTSEAVFDSLSEGKRYQVWATGKPGSNLYNRSISRIIEGE